MEQAPLDLPPTKKAVQSHLSPYFKYEEVATKIDDTSPDGKFRDGDHLKIVFENGALRIKAPSFGKIVTLDGGVYQATEILFNTPSGHKINGESFDMEMQVVHTGISKGDIAKSVILSFLFKKKAGASNKFLEKLEIFNLPNPFENFRELQNPVFIPNVLLSEDEDDLGTMIPFSFYTYPGSLMEPPCKERTIIYVASKPIETSYYSMQLMKEALKWPDMIDNFGGVHIHASIVDNNRDVQRQHGRSIFWYDSSACDLMLRKKGPAPEKGHYEKVIKPAKRYFWVNGNKPSGLPNAWVVTEKEAKGLTLLP